MKTKRILLFAAAICIFATTAIAQNQSVTTPRSASPAAEVSQRIGLTDITVNYSRPRVTLNGNDRSGKIWGGQVPYGLQKINFANQGNIPWRAGANENTTFETSHAIKVEGKDLPAGKYSLHMIIKEDDTATIIFNSNTKSWGSFFYDEKADVLRVDVKMKDIPHTEILTYSFPDMDNDSATLALSWEKKQIPIRIDVDVHEIVVANFREELNGFSGFFWQGFQAAANYCLTNNVNTKEALGWAEIAVQRNPSFQTHSTHAGLLFQDGKVAESDAALDKAVKLANRNQINAVGYALLGQKRFQKAIAVFTMNTESNPNDANGFDSLGEAYKLAGDKANAIKNLRKALSLNPAPNVKANSEKLLKELGESIE